jgi:cell division protein ZapA (FtsZ GTPase activity inhibitor)
MTETTFSDRKLSEKELEDLVLIAVAKREQMVADEKLDLMEKPRNSLAFTGNVRSMARFEGWRCDVGDVDTAVRRLVAAGMMVTDGDPAKPGQSGHSVRLRASGYARALTVSRQYLGEPLVFFKRDKTFDDNGFGQVDVNFLGERIVIGCVEGEEDRAIQFAHRFEVDTGEVLKAVGGLDRSRAILMAGILAHEHIDELETEMRTSAPASDRTVGLDHNSAEYQTVVAAVDRLIVVVQTSNVYRETAPQDHERRLAELEAGRRLLGSKWLSLKTLKVALIGTITYLAAKFADAPIGEAAVTAWNALKVLLGLRH